MENNTDDVRNKFLRNLNTPWKMRLWFFSKLPSLFFWGVRIQEVTPLRGITTIPAGWRTQNPFRSTYFAAQCGAAELSTGVLAMSAIQAQPFRVSMLVTQVEATFVKKAISRIAFTCEDGEAMAAAIQESVETGEARVFTATSTGRQHGDETVSVIKITWSFKAKLQ